MRRLLIDRTVKTKIFIVVAVMLLAGVATGVTGLLKIGALQDEHHRQLDRAVPFISSLQQVATTAKAAAVDERGFLISGDEKFSDEFVKRFALIEENLGAARTTAASPAQAAQVDEIAEGIGAWQEAVAAEFTGYATDKEAATRAALGPNRDLRKAYETELDAALKGAREQLTASTQFNETVDSARFLVVLVLVLGTVWSLLNAVVLTKAVVGPVRTVAGVLTRMAAGDLTGRAPVRSKDELGQMAGALNQAAEAMQTTVRTIDGSSTSLAGAAEELTATSTQIASTAEETSAQAGIVTAAADEVSRNVDTVASG
ncbi:HAMP domain-containing protein, partial [Planobispora takensis]